MPKALNPKIPYVWPTPHCPPRVPGACARCAALARSLGSCRLPDKELPSAGQTVDYPPVALTRGAHPDRGAAPTAQPKYPSTDAASARVRLLPKV